MFGNGWIVSLTCYVLLWHSMQSIHIRTIAVMKQQRTGLIVLKFLVHIEYTYLFPVSMQCTGVEWWQLIKIHTFHLRNCANVLCSFRIRRENLQNSTMEITFWKVFNKTLYCAMASFFYCTHMNSVKKRLWPIFGCIPERVLYFKQQWYPNGYICNGDMLGTKIV